MEPKTVIYILGAVLYFIYTITKNKKAREQEHTHDETPEYPVPDQTAGKPPVTTNPLEEILQEMKRKQQELQTREKVSAPVVKQQKQPAREILLKQKKQGVFEEGNYVRELTDEEKIVRGNIKIENEGIYRINPMEEVEAEQEAFEIDMREAVIGSLILERKF